MGHQKINSYLGNKCLARKVLQVFPDRNVYDLTQITASFRTLQLFVLQSYHPLLCKLPVN